MMKKISQESSDEDEGFDNNPGLIVVQRLKSGQSTRKFSDLIPEANPIVKYNGNEDLRYVIKNTQINKYGLYIRETYENRILVYERIQIPEDIITIDNQYLIDASFPKLNPSLTYKSIDHTLIHGLRFFSDFDSGNLYRVYKVNEVEYDLILQNDINSKGVTGWFHFAIQCGINITNELTFNIVNFTKNHSLFTKGAQPLIKSHQLQQERGVEWFRHGSAITYTQNKILRKIGIIDSNNSSVYLNTLTFKIKLLKQPDVVYIAMNYPYGYSELTNYIDNIKNYVKTQGIMGVYFDKLCNSYLGKACPIIKINQARQKFRQQKTIVIMARQHPAETLSSYCIQYMITSLLQTNHCEWLRDNFNWVFVPMVNVDGVILGNSRCDANGYDLNRVWSSPKLDTQPTVYYLKELCRNFKREGSLEMILDLHSHSKSLNAFAYSYEADFVNSRIFPLLIDQISKIFSINQCSFSIHKNRIGTARQVLIQEILCSQTYTIEISYSGYNKNHTGFKQFTLKDIDYLANDILKGIYLLYCDEIAKKQAINKIDQNYEYFKKLNQDDISNSESDTESDDEDIKIIPPDNPSPPIKRKHRNKNKSRKNSPESKKLNKETQKLNQNSNSKDQKFPKVLPLQTSHKFPQSNQQSNPINQVVKKIDNLPKLSQKNMNLLTVPSIVNAQQQKVSPRSRLLDSTPSPDNLKKKFQSQDPIVQNYQTKIAKYLDSQLNNLKNSDITPQTTMEMKGINSKNSKNSKNHLSDQPRRIKTETPFININSNIYQEKIRQREKMNAEKIRQLRYDSTQEDPQSALLIERRPKQRGNVLFSPFEPANRVHSVYYTSVQMRILYQKEPRRQRLLTPISKNMDKNINFEDWELDPQSLKY